MPLIRRLFDGYRPRFQALILDLGPHRNGCVQSELDSRFGRQLQMLGSLAGDDGTRRAPAPRSDSCPCSTTGDSANSRAKAGTSGNLPRRLLAFTRALRLDLGGGDLVPPPAKRDRVRPQLALVAPFEFARLFDVGRLQRNARLARDDHFAPNHDRI